MNFIYEYFESTLFFCGFVYIIAAGIMLIYPPKTINSLYGYRTARSMKNQQNWDFSQKYGAKTMLWIGIAFAGLSPIISLLNHPETEIIIGLSILTASAVVIFLVTEKAIKKQENP